MACEQTKKPTDYVNDELTRIRMKACGRGCGDIFSQKRVCN